MNSGDLFQRGPSGLLSFQGICHKSDERLQTPARHHYRNGWYARYVQTGVCCTARKTEYDLKRTLNNFRKIIQKNELKALQRAIH